jgi:peptidoglycan/LPS O-acetylase OafA/YrhL
MPNRRPAIIPALVLIALGAWLLAENLGVPLPTWDQAWPAFPFFFGLAFVLQFFLGGRTDTGLVFVGVAAALVGAFFFAFTLGYLRWNDMAVYWPVFVLIGSAAFFAQWLVRPRERGLLVPAFLALGVGGLALPITLRLINPSLANVVVKFWPVALILLGLALLVGFFQRR